MGTSTLLNMPFSDETRDALRSLGIDHGGSQDDAAVPLDLRTIPVDQWEQYDCYPVVIPPAIAHYLGTQITYTKEPLAIRSDAIEMPRPSTEVCDLFEGAPTRADLTTLEKDNIEQAIETFHNVQPPWVIVLRDGVARLMKE